MPATVVQSASNGSASGALSVTLGVAPTENNHLILVMSSGDNMATNMKTDAEANGWTEAFGVNYVAEDIWVGWKLVTAGMSATQGVRASSVFGTIAQVIEVAQLERISPASPFVDAANLAIGSGEEVVQTTPTNTTAGANRFMLSTAIGRDNGSTGSGAATHGGSWTQIRRSNFGAGANSRTIASAYQIVPTSGTVVAQNVVWPASTYDRCSSHITEWIIGPELGTGPERTTELHLSAIHSETDPAVRHSSVSLRALASDDAAARTSALEQHALVSEESPARTGLVALSILWADPIRTRRMGASVKMSLDASESGDLETSVPNPWPEPDL